MPNEANIQIAGHLGRDAMLRKIGDKDVASLSVAVKTGWGDRQKTTWYDVSIWGKPAEWMSRLKKSDGVYVRGEPEMRTWEKDGATRYQMHINVGGWAGGTAWLIPKDESRSGGGGGQSQDVPF